MNDPATNDPNCMVAVYNSHTGAEQAVAKLSRFFRHHKSFHHW